MKSVWVAAPMTEAMHEAVRKAAYDAAVSKGEIIRRAVALYVDRTPAKGAAKQS